MAPLLNINLQMYKPPAGLILEKVEPLPLPPWQQSPTTNGSNPYEDSGVGYEITNKGQGWLLLQVKIVFT